MNHGNVLKILFIKGGVIHSTKYKSGKAYKNKTVLEVGAGNSGMEIALDWRTTVQKHPSLSEVR